MSSSGRMLKIAGQGLRRLSLEQHNDWYHTSRLSIRLFRSVVCVAPEFARWIPSSHLQPQRRLCRLGHRAPVSAQEAWILFTAMLSTPASARLFLAARAALGVPGSSTAIVYLHTGMRRRAWHQIHLSKDEVPLKQSGQRWRAAGGPCVQLAPRAAAAYAVHTMQPTASNKSSSSVDA